MKMLVALIIILFVSMSMIMGYISLEMILGYASFKNIGLGIIHFIANYYNTFCLLCIYLLCFGRQS